MASEVADAGPAVDDDAQPARPPFPVCPPLQPHRGKPAAFGADLRLRDGRKVLTAEPHFERLFIAAYGRVQEPRPFGCLLGKS